MAFTPAQLILRAVRIAKDGAIETNEATIVFIGDDRKCSAGSKGSKKEAKMIEVRHNSITQVLCEWSQRAGV